MVFSRDALDVSAHVLIYIHSGIGCAQETILGQTIFGIESESNAGRTLDDVPLGDEWTVKAPLQPASNFFDFSAVVNLRQKHRELVAPQSGEHVVGAKMLLHADRHVLEIQVSRLVAVHVVDPFEIVEIDVDQSKDTCILPCQINLVIEKPLQGESV